LAPADVVVASLVSLACLRGLAIGLAREVLSLAAVAGACVAVRLGWAPLTGWISQAIGWQGLPAHLAAALVLAGGSLAGLVLLGTLARRALRAAGLGWWDRLFGAVLGAAEGALVAALVLLVVIAAVGKEHPILAGTRSLAAFERLEALASRSEPSRDVAAPPRG
jgi:uncharacterized membrane protein required for colicin V production